MLSMRQRVQGVEDPIEFSFDELSPGQKKLVALYTVLHLGTKAGSTVCLDEADNYIALRELQPWLAAVEDAGIENDLQVLLISHNPEVINYLAPQSGLLFDRTENGPTRCKPFPLDNSLEPAELVARGWESG